MLQARETPETSGSPGLIRERLHEGSDPSVIGFMDRRGEIHQGPTTKAFKIPGVNGWRMDNNGQMEDGLKMDGWMDE